MARNFIGGFYAGYENLPKGLKTEPFFPKQAVLPLPDGYTPTVGIGDRVKIGDIAAECPDSVCVLCTVSGTVTGTDGAVTVASDGRNTVSEDCRPVTNELRKMTEPELRSALYRMGVPAPEPGKKSPVCLTVDCCEPRPASVSARMTVLERGASVIGGAKIFMKLLGAKKAILAVPSFMYEYANTLESFLPDADTVKAVAVSDKYPQSVPHLLISAIFNINIGVSVRTDDAGYPVVTAELCAAAYDALANGIPYTSGTLTASGLGDARSFRIPFGTAVDELREYLGAAEANGGIPCYPEVPRYVRPGFSVVFFGEKDPEPAQHRCALCGRCVSVCPVSLVPALIADSLMKTGECPERYSAESCILCRCCDSICPSGIRISDLIAAHIGGKGV